MAALAVVDKTASAVSTAGPVKVCVLLLVIFPPILIPLELVRLKIPIGAIAPIVDPKAIAPAPLLMVKF